MDGNLGKSLDLIAFHDIFPSKFQEVEVFQLWQEIKSKGVDLKEFIKLFERPKIEI